MKLVLALAVLTPPLALAGWGVIVLNRRQHAELTKRQGLLDAVPKDLRFRPEPAVFRLAAVLVFIAALMAGSAIAGPDGVLAAAVLAIAVIYPVLLRHRARHRQEVIATVERRAATMSSDELRGLVAGLELEHGQAEMRPLRRLVPSAFPDHE